MRRNTSSNARSSSAVSRSHSSMKFGRETATSSPGLRSSASTSKRGSYGNEGSQRTPKKFSTRRSVGNPLSSHPIG